MLASIVLVSASWIAQATGSIAGCIMDPMRQPLPGVTVVAAGRVLETYHGDEQDRMLPAERIEPRPVPSDGASHGLHERDPR